MIVGPTDATIAAMTTMTPPVQILPAILLILLATLAAGCAATGARQGGSPGDSDRVEREIAELHTFFQEWFRGVLPDTDAAFARFERAMAPGFVIVTPDGRALDRATILGAVRSGHGRDTTARVWTEDARVLHTVGGAVVATYVEWQSLGVEPPRARLSTVVLEPDLDAPGGLRWVHVHETWLPE